MQWRFCTKFNFISFLFVVIVVVVAVAATAAKLEPNDEDADDVILTTKTEDIETDDITEEVVMEQ